MRDCQAGSTRHVAWQQYARRGMRGGMPIAADGSTRSDRRRAVGPRPKAHSCRPTKALAGLRLPVGEEIADVDVSFQLDFFLLGELTFVGSEIEFFNTSGIFVWEVEGQDAFSERRSHPVSGQVEHPEQNISVRFGAKRGFTHPVPSL